jgi:hypothetical protein
MSKSWTPPKGISVIYKGKGYRKKTKPGKDHHDSSTEKEQKHEDTSEKDDESN